MNITIVTQWFPPEHAPIGYMLQELGDELARQGHHVTVITGFPNHPRGVVFDGFTKCWLKKETLGDVEVLRTWLFTSPSRSLLSRANTFLTFTATSLWTLLRHTKPDVIFGVFQPLTVGLSLTLAKALKASRLVLNVQDLHPDALVSMGVLKNRGVVALFRRLETFGYRHADALVVISEGFRAHVIQRGAEPNRVVVIGNWIDTDALKCEEPDNEVRATLGASDGTFLVLYAGTIGYASGAEVLVDAARLLATEPTIRIAFVGEGPLIPTLKMRVESADLHNVSFLPFQPREKVPRVQASCDVAVVSLRPGHGRLSVPSKILGYMAAGRAVVASVDSGSETAELVEAACCGIVVPAGDAVALSDALRSLRDDPVRRAQFGNNGREYAAKHCSKGVTTRRYAEFLSTVATW